MKEGTRWLIRNGTKINFWHDNWTGNGPLRNAIQGPFNGHNASTLLHETWDHNRDWALDNLSFVFPHNILNTIKATPKPFHSDLEDLPTWDPSPNGMFSTNSAYILSQDLPTPFLEMDLENSYPSKNSNLSLVSISR